jgi:hypothetical protein
MKFLSLIFLLGLVSCQPTNPTGDKNVIQSDDYVLVEFAAKLEEAEQQEATAP